MNHWMPLPAEAIMGRRKTKHRFSHRGPNARAGVENLRHHSAVPPRSRRLALRQRSSGPRTHCELAFQEGLGSSVGDAVWGHWGALLALELSLYRARRSLPVGIRR